MNFSDSDQFQNLSARLPKPLGRGPCHSARSVPWPHSGQAKLAWSSPFSHASQAFSHSENADAAESESSKRSKVYRHVSQRSSSPFWYERDISRPTKISRPFGLVSGTDLTQ